jgi:AraC-like DNA-binding protein
MTIPLTWFLQWHLPEPMNQSVLHGQVVVEQDQSPASGDVARFGVWAGDLASDSSERARACALEVEARLRRLSLSLKGGSSPVHRHQLAGSVPDQGLSCAERMASYIAMHYTEPLSARQISEHVGLSTNYAMTLFGRTFGTTLVSYVTQHRLSHAQRLLVSTGHPVIDVAFQSGFGSLSRFHQSFKEAFGCTPLKFRMKVRRAK